MRRSKKFVPYVRLANGREKSNSYRTAIRLAFFAQIGKPYYVMVQRGFPNLAIDAGRSKQDIMMSPVVARLKKKSFRTWSRSFKEKRS